MGDLTGFPTVEVPQVLYRAHIHGPWWFSSVPLRDCSEPTGRFDLLYPSGTCYLAAGPVAAARERLGAHPSRVVHADRQSQAAVVSQLTVGDWEPVADLEHSDAPLFGVTRELSILPDYVLSSAWAQALDGVAAGIRYALRFGIPDAGYALFGEAGEHQDRATDARPRRFLDILKEAGYEILDAPAHLDAVPPEG